MSQLCYGTITRAHPFTVEEVVWLLLTVIPEREGTEQPEEVYGVHLDELREKSGYDDKELLRRLPDCRIWFIPAPAPFDVPRRPFQLPWQIHELERYMIAIPETKPPRREPARKPSQWARYHNYADINWDLYDDDRDWDDQSQEFWNQF